MVTAVITVLQSQDKQTYTKNTTSINQIKKKYPAPLSQNIGVPPHFPTSTFLMPRMSTKQTQSNMYSMQPKL